mmetsp:Transcript_28265/g.76337  ORF Transcript_28265/g.76337 Transcript_28265/m.76337 type:complete len:252 (-) Transcript_28265:400-1155(-)
MAEHSTSKQSCMNSSSSAVPGSLPLYSATHCSRTSIPFNSPNFFWFFSEPWTRTARSSDACCLLLSNSRGRMRPSSHFIRRVFSTTCSATLGSVSTMFSNVLRQLNTALASSSTFSLKLVSLCTSSSRTLFSSKAATRLRASSSCSCRTSASVSSISSSTVSPAMSVFSWLRQDSSVGKGFSSTSRGYRSGEPATCSKLLTCSSRSTSLSKNFSGASAYFMRCSRFSLYFFSSAVTILLRPFASKSWIWSI